MNKLYLWGIIITILMLAATYYTLVLTAGESKSLSEVLSSDAINTLAILGAVALVIITVFVVIKYVRQMQTDQATGELADESWDNIGEYKNPVPFGWAIMFIGTMIWGMWYFTIGYPVNAFSQIGQYNEEVAELNKKFDADFEKKMASMTDEEKHEYLHDMGESLFIAECQVCHGANADGKDTNDAVVAANLNEWGKRDGILNTIANGSKGLGYPMGEMPAGMASGQDAKDIATYVLNGLSGDTGAEAFANACAACHGADGKGMDGMAPNLANYGKPPFAVDVLNRGKKGFIGHMPSFKNRLNDKQKEAVATYVSDLGKGE
jgi:cytochrome c oxidase cbb3-type subunit 3